MKTINLFLDDIRIPNMSHNSEKGLGPNLKWVIVRDFFEFVNFVEKNFDNINLISFDHDLACVKDDVEYTGKSAVDWLINFCLDNDKTLPNWYVHSDNTSGKRNMISALTNYLEKVEGKDLSNFRYFHNGLINDVPV
jgi:hypothetical protein